MIRCGIGYDAHRLVSGRKLILGGVKIPHPRGLEGHSDADVLSHAIADAILGAIGAKATSENIFRTRKNRFAESAALKFCVTLRQSPRKKMRER